MEHQDQLSPAMARPRQAIYRGCWQGLLGTDMQAPVAGNLNSTPFPEEQMAMQLPGEQSTWAAAGLHALHGSLHGSLRLMAAPCESSAGIYGGVKGIQVLTSMCEEGVFSEQLIRA